MKIRVLPTGFALAAALSIALFCGPTHAQLFLPNPAAATTITLDAQSSVEVDNDRMHVTLGTSEDGEDTRALTQRVLARLNEALTQAQKTAGVEARLGGVTTQPIYDAKGKTPRWTVSGSIVLQSRNFAELGALSSDLSREMRIQSVDFSLSSAAHDKARDKLIAELAQSVEQKARATAAAFGFAQYRIQSLALDQSQAMPRPMRALAMAKGADMASESMPLPTEGGTTTVTLHVTATLQADGKAPVRLR
ncbi:SIMPL domain-containing protein [Hylemonella sp. W303a]|uniref:SIMPL domain-containing protein n=1 Tax=Hylemonella sp. W303a TaxID=3389873 RepID=UPI00396B2132